MFWCVRPLYSYDISPETTDANNSQKNEYAFRSPIQKFCDCVLDDEKFGATVRDLLMGVVYDRLKNTPFSKV